LSARQSANFVLTGTSVQDVEQETKIINCIVNSTISSSTTCGSSYGIKVESIAEYESFDEIETITFDTAGAVLLESTSAVFSPDRSYIATVGARIILNGNNTNVKISAFDGVNATDITTALFSAYGNNSDFLNDASWHPTGNYLAVCSSAFMFRTTTADEDVRLRVLEFDGATLTSLIETEKGNNELVFATRSIAFSPNGNYLVAGIGDRVAVFGFDGTALTELDSATDASLGISQKYAVRFSPDGQYIAVAVFSGVGFKILKFDPDATAPNILTVFDNAAYSSVGIGFSPDGKYIAVAGPATGGNEVNVFAFNPAAGGRGN